MVAIVRCSKTPGQSRRSKQNRAASKLRNTKASRASAHAWARSSTQPSQSLTEPTCPKSSLGLRHLSPRAAIVAPPRHRFLILSTPSPSSVLLPPRHGSPGRGAPSRNPLVSSLLRSVRALPCQSQMVTTAASTSTTHHPLLPFLLRRVRYLIQTPLL